MRGGERRRIVEAVTDHQNTLRPCRARSASQSIFRAGVSAREPSFNACAPASCGGARPRGGRPKAAPQRGAAPLQRFHDLCRIASEACRRSESATVLAHSGGTKPRCRRCWRRPRTIQPSPAAPRRAAKSAPGHARDVSSTPSAATTVFERSFAAATIACA